jgi:HD-like signal output (HDOD) protein
VRLLFGKVIELLRSLFGWRPRASRSKGSLPHRLSPPRRPSTSPGSGSKEQRVPAAGSQCPTVASALLPSPGSWERGKPVVGVEAEAVRAELVKELFGKRDSSLTPNDAAFIERLLRVVVGEKLEIPPFPDIARKLDSLLKKGDPRMSQVTRLVERDSALVRRVWKAGSSAVFPGPPDNVHHAIARIGFDALWRIGMSICVHSPLFRVAGYQARADAVRDHGLVVADMAAWLSGETRGKHYLAGLLHDVGKLVVFRAASTKDPEARPSEKLVDEILNRHHSSIGVLAASAWALGDEVSEAIGFHHAPELGGSPAKILWVADVATITAALELSGQASNGLHALERVSHWTSFSGEAAVLKAHALLVAKYGADSAPAPHDNDRGASPT